MKQVIVFPRGQLSAKDRERMTRAGFVAVEADDPHKVVTAMPSAPLLTADEMMIAAACAIRTSTNAISAFGTELAKRIQAKEQK